MPQVVQDGRVTFVLPNYNHAPFLPVSLGNALGQTRPADKILIIDDASTDNSLEIIQDMASGHAHVEIIKHAKNEGCLKTLEEGLRRTKTEFISFLAADDYLAPSYLEKYLSVLHRSPQAAFCSGACQIVDEKGKELDLRPLFYPLSEAGFIPPSEVNSLLKKCDNFLIGTGALYRRRLILEIGGYDLSLQFLMDSMLMRHLALKYGFCFMPEPLAAWRFLGNNSSVKNIVQKQYLEELIRSSKSYINSQNEGLFPENYGNLLERRLRFGAARLQMEMSPLFQGPKLGRLVTVLSLFYLFAVLRPFSFFLTLKALVRRRKHR